MKEAKEFVVNRIESLVERINTIKCSLITKELSCAIYVKIESSQEKLSVGELDIEKFNILDEFYSQNFNATLVFVNDDSLLDLGEYTFSLIGEKYFDVNSLLKFSISDLRCFNNEVNILLPETMIEVPENNYALAA